MCTVKVIWLPIGIFLAAVLLSAFLPRASQPTAIAPAARKAVVVELFTSEGCSSCPPADELLGRLRQERRTDGIEVIPLGLHVDYWNFQGWTDRFSSSAYSQRQLKYEERLHVESPYTPQLVIDGASEAGGDDNPRAHFLIAQAALRPAPAEVQITAAGEDKVQVSIKASQTVPGEVMLACTEDNLATKVRAGENNGRELRHSAVVRELRSLGHLHDGGFESSVPLKLKSDWKRNDVRVVVFVQEPDNGAIEGAASLQLGGQSASAR